MVIDQEGNILSDTSSRSDTTNSESGLSSLTTRSDTKPFLPVVLGLGASLGLIPAVVTVTESRTTPTNWSYKHFPWSTNRTILQPVARRPTLDTIKTSNKTLSPYFSTQYYKVRPKHNERYTPSQIRIRREGAKLRSGRILEVVGPRFPRHRQDFIRPPTPPLPSRSESNRSITSSAYSAIIAPRYRVTSPAYSAVFDNPYALTAEDRTNISTEQGIDLFTYCPKSRKSFANV
jgi:hypothetical protein